ncbi:MAG: trypsin-like peptidase domain-containing protein [Nocardiopsaceae bacterium]|nr:trypsin-like peptidase domain-containing protein [Nocardiopsaceae bacterium]
MASPSLVLTPAWQVRIKAPDDLVVGGGVLVPGNRILTCVHVINAALGRRDDPLPPGPEYPVRVDIPCRTEYRPELARVVGTAWNAERDTTLLEFDAGRPRPPVARLGARMGDIAVSGRPRPVRVQGYPRDSPHGLRADARVVGPGGDLPHRAQVHIDRAHPSLFEPGFSGCGVLDPQDGTVIGILIKARYTVAGGGGHVALMEPVEMVAPLAELLVDEELDALRPALGALRFEAVAAAYAAATRHRIPESAVFGSAWEAFAHLRELAPREDGVPVEVVFVEEIAKSGVANTRVLRAYSDSRSSSAVPHDALQRLRGEDGLDPPGPGTLIFSAEPVPDDPDRPARYVLSHWTDNGRDITNGGSAVVTEEGLRESVVRAIEEAEARPDCWGREPPVLRLEFFLPFSLLTQRIAEWRMRAPASGEGERVGAAYEIILHHADRLDVHEKQWGRARNKLIMRWRELARNGGGVLFRIPPDSAAGSRVPLQDRLSDPAIVAVALGAHPSDEEGERQLYRALEAGLPAIAWIDTDDAESTRRFHDSLESAVTRSGDSISRDDITSLPHHLYSLRARTRNPDHTDEGYDPYGITIILDSVPRIRKLLHTGILAAPSRTR